MSSTDLCSHRGCGRDDWWRRCVRAWCVCMCVRVTPAHTGAGRWGPLLNSTCDATCRVSNMPVLASQTTTVTLLRCGAHSVIRRFPPTVEQRGQQVLAGEAWGVSLWAGTPLLARALRSVASTFLLWQRPRDCRVRRSSAGKRMKYCQEIQGKVGLWALRGASLLRALESLGFS